MKAKIFYFSGTGNSLFISKEISKTLNDCPIISIPKIKNEKEIIINEDIIGIIYPVYCQTIPENIKKFIEKLDFESNPYIFSIATNNGAPGRANDDLDRALKKIGQHLDLGYSIVMPGNSIIIADYTNSQEEREMRLERSKKSLIKISNSIQKKTTDYIESDKSIRWLIQGKITSLVMRIYNVPGRFWTNSKCTKCGICIKLCPEKNIRIDAVIKWGKSCISCLACFHWCPNKAVELDKYSKDRLRYHHPEIDIKEMYL